MQHGPSCRDPCSDVVCQGDIRKRFYPGDSCVDISGIDIYPNSYYGWKDYREDTYAKAFQIMKRVSPNKIMALAEWIQHTYNHEFVITRDELPCWK